MVTFKEFEKIIKFLKETDSKGDRVDKLLSEMSDGFYMNLVSGLTLKHESIIIELLNKIFNLQDIENIGTDLEYWIYDLEFGTRWTEDSLIDKDGKSIKIQTTREIYNYLVENNKSEQRQENGLN